MVIILFVGLSGTPGESDLFSKGLDEPLGDDEVLPEIKAYSRATATYSGLSGGANGSGSSANWMADARTSSSGKHRYYTDTATR